MAKIDVTDEAIIDAPPMEVYKAILDVYAGTTHLFMPALESKVRGDKPVVCEGAICDVIGHSHGLTTKFSVKVTKAEKGKSIDLELGGDFLGNENWTFEPVENGKTNVKLRFVGKTNRILFSILSPFVSAGKEHSKTIQYGLKACNSYLCKK
jgi:ribosome-associated toxin RatA of RatAB toxin-antitoxin module